MYSPEEVRRLMVRWAAFLTACFVLTAAMNVSFSRYLLEEREDDPDTHLDRAEDYLAAGEYKLAIVSVENAYDRAPLYPRVHKVHGDILFNQGEYVRAEPEYRKCLDLDGKYEGVQNNILWCLIEQEAYDQAVVLGKKFLKEEGQVSRLIPRYVAEAYMRSSRWPEALDYLKLALEYNPKNTYLLQRLAMAYRKTGNAAEEERVLARLGEIELELEKEEQLTQKPVN